MVVSRIPEPNGVVIGSKLYRPADSPGIECSYLYNSLARDGILMNSNIRGALTQGLFNVCLFARSLPSPHPPPQHGRDYVGGLVKRNSLDVFQILTVILFSPLVQDLKGPFHQIKFAQKWYS
jgi:hypothetical protein